jgi:hypothetical protein
MSPQIRKVTNLSKHTNIKIAFKCKDTIAQLLKPANITPPTPTMIEVAFTHQLVTHASRPMWVKPATVSSYDTKSIQDTLKTIIQPQATPYISSRTDMNTDP